MSVLITGGAGFIGSHVANRCIKEGEEVYVLDNLSTGTMANIPAGAHFLNLDLSRESFVDGLSEIRVDTVIHLAAQSSGEISYERPSYDLKTNTLGTLLLLKWALERDVEKFIYSSSMSVYGDGRDWPLTESDAVSPKSFYGVGKCASEQYVNIFNDMGLNTTSLRFFNVYGPGQNMKNLKQGMVSIYMAYIARNEPVLVKGSLDRFRDFVYIDDVVDAIMRCRSESRSNGETFNVCTGRKTRISELLGIIVEAFGHRDGDYPIVTGDPTPRDQFGTYGNYDGIQSSIGWEPTVSLEVGIGWMAEWVREATRKGAL